MAVFDNDQLSDDQQADNRRLTRRLMVILLAMFGFGFALVPLYNVVCDLTGLNGRTTGTQTATEAAAFVADKNRTVNVLFVSNVDRQLGWEFRPEVTQMQVHPGQFYTTAYYAENKMQRAMTGQASPSVAPGLASRYFQKTECFCFTQQHFGAGESRDMPVTFVIDPALPEHIDTVTLSYTFFESKQLAAQ